MEESQKDMMLNRVITEYVDVSRKLDTLQEKWDECTSFDYSSTRDQYRALLKREQFLLVFLENML